MSDSLPSPMTAPSSILETIRWRDGRVRILDQRRLPGAEVYLEIEERAGVEEAIRTLAVRGAPAIGIAGALALALEAASLPDLPAGEFLRSMGSAAEEVAAVRPTAVNLQWACARVVRDLESSVLRVPFRGWAPAVLHTAETILAEDLDLSVSMGRHGAPLLPDEARVVSHCNTGGLATGGGGTALGLVFEAVRQGKRIFVHVDETRPLLQGARLTAWELQRLGIPYAVHCDSAAAWLMKTTRIDAVLVGADRVVRNGDTANKVGTYPLALAAREAGTPVYVVAPRSSFDLSLATGDEIPIEERAEDEVLEWQGGRSAPVGARGWNPAFDVTPAALIAAWITERGVERPPFLP